MTSRAAAELVLRNPIFTGVIIAIAALMMVSPSIAIAEYNQEGKPDMFKTKQKNQAQIALLSISVVVAVGMAITFGWAAWYANKNGMRWTGNAITSSSF